ncbi:corticotropin-releasing factor receptor 2-like [Panulirus ornatus]|uniref:corticotropin-releasing factor receptor 2-like n=1 Tax=Panulirus ornatus TaxID=150431 RepID=UPI003A839FED
MSDDRSASASAPLQEELSVSARVAELDLYSTTTPPGPGLFPHHSLHPTLPPEARSCLEDSWADPPTDGVYCNATWDTLYCWPATQAGSTVRESCANIFSDVPDLLNYPDAMAYRECDPSGQWLWGGWTNYSQCLSVIEHQVGSAGVVDAVRYITFIGALLSLLTLTITIFIFTYFRTLECDRLRVHRNLVVSLIIRFLVMVVLTEPFISNRHTLTYRDLDWLCKSLLALRMYAQMASINWMFVEGLFLHSRLTSNVFDSGAPFALYYIIGWGWPLVFLAAWAASMSLYYPVHCWRSYGTLPYIWILVAPMVTALMINLLFLVNIIRILVTKLRASDAYVRKAIKATAVLFPLLGITNLLFAVNPGDKGDLEDAYMLTNALLQSSQGVFVSVLYCFLNAEVQELLRKRWQQYRVQQSGHCTNHRRKDTKGSVILNSSMSLRFNAQTPRTRLLSPQTPSTQVITTLSSRLHSPQAPSSQLLSPETPSPQLLSLDTSSHQLFSPDIPSPQLFSPDIPSPQLFSSDIPSPQLFSSDTPKPHLPSPHKPSSQPLSPSAFSSQPLCIHASIPQTSKQHFSSSIHRSNPLDLNLQPANSHLPGGFDSLAKRDLKVSSV